LVLVERFLQEHERLRIARGVDHRVERTIHGPERGLRASGLGNPSR
jgi:hypothetical protein